MNKILSTTIFLLSITGCAAMSGGESGAKECRPGKSIRATLDNAIKTLEGSDCKSFAVNFLSPIKLQQIDDLAAYEEQMACKPENQRNIDDVIFALKLARLAEPETNGVIATIDMSGAGTRPEQFILIRYTDKRWYFNSL